MAKLYSKNLKSEQINMSPKNETIDFLLSYSKSLSVLEYNKLKFETVLN